MSKDTLSHSQISQLLSKRGNMAEKLALLRLLSFSAFRISAFRISALFLAFHSKIHLDLGMLPKKDNHLYCVPLLASPVFISLI